MFKRIWSLYQAVLAFIEEKLGLHDQFENTLDRWERKGLVRRMEHPTTVQKFCREDAQLLRREKWDDVLEETRSEPGKEWDGVADLTLAQLKESPSDSSRPTRRLRKANRRRLRRLYRWQLREERRRGPIHRETYDDLVRESLADEERRRRGDTGS